MNLAAKLTAIFLLLSIAPLSLVGYLAYGDGRQAIEQAVIDRLLTTTLLKEAELVGWLDASKGGIRSLAQRPLIRQYAAVLASRSPTDPQYQVAYDRVRQDHFLPRMEESGTYLDFSLIRATDGLVLVSTREQLEGKYRERAVFFIEGRQDTYIENVSYELTQGELVMPMGTPVEDENGTVIAVLASYLNLSGISDIVTRRSGLRESEKTYLVNTFNYMITGSLAEPGSSLKRAVYTDGVNDCLAHHNGNGFYADYRGVPVIGAYRWMPERKLCIVTEMDESEALAPIVNLRNSILLIGVMVGLGVMVAGVFFARTITTPVRQLVRGTQEIGQGNLSYRAGASAKDEIGQLSRAFDQMVEVLKATTVSRDELADEVTERIQAEEALRRYAERLAAINRLDRVISSNLEMALVYDSFVKELVALVSLDRTSIVLLNEAGDQWQVARMWTGYEPVITPGVWRRVPGSVIEWLVTHRVPFLENEIGERGDWPETALLRREGIRSRLLLPLIIQDQVAGALTAASREPAAFSEGDQHILAAIADQLSIAVQNARLYEQVQRHAANMEQRVLERTAQLEAANKELEAFAYSVAHDLRSPLRAIDGFSRIVLRDYAALLPDEGQYHIQRVRDNTQQMGRLIDDLLTFSRLNRQPLNREPVAPTDLVRRVLGDLSGEQEGRQVEITIGELPHCWADPTLLKQVLVNLLSNALKFTRQRDVAHIEVGCYQLNGETVYYVKDNGAGFDMRYAGKLFSVFQRLHRAEDYEGTGVGLATVQRIIHRHGGRVWAEAEVDKGATFCFTLEGDGRYD